MAKKSEKDEGLDRRSFLKISSAAAVTAAVGGTAVAAPEEAKKAVKPSETDTAKPNLKGRWFAV